MLIGAIDSTNAYISAIAGITETTNPAMEPMDEVVQVKFDLNPEDELTWYEALAPYASAGLGIRDQIAKVAEEQTEEELEDQQQEENTGRGLKGTKQRYGHQKGPNYLDEEEETEEAEESENTSTAYQELINTINNSVYRSQEIPATNLIDYEQSEEAVQEIAEIKTDTYSQIPADTLFEAFAEENIQLNEALYLGNIMPAFVQPINQNIAFEKYLSLQNEFKTLRVSEIPSLRESLDAVA